MRSTYLCDRRLVAALLAAHRRGVRVRLALEARPRTPEVNNDAIARLSEEMSFRQFRPIRAPALVPGIGRLSRVRANLHAKIYAFTHPYPHVLIGSFNPSGDVAGDRRLVDRIGDQDRGCNVLVEITGARVRTFLRDHVHRLLARGDRIGFRFRRRDDRMIAAGATEIMLLPAPGGCPVISRLARLGAGARLGMTASHMKTTSVIRALCRAGQRGAKIDIVCHDTERRVPEAALDRLRSAGITAVRYRHPERLPMHYKFVLVEDGRAREAWFGSFNLNCNSLFFNHEVMARSVCPALFSQFGRCWKRLVDGIRT